ncbi:MAG: hypothetical protein GX351_08065 [Peptococcaceae bacterium]|nr:hypothetical protein [Peptococcaceae bacterium]
MLTPYGMTVALADWGGAGLLVMVMNAGNAVAGATMELLAGNAMPILIVFGLFATLTIIGVATGLVYSTIVKKPLGSGAPKSV